MGTRAPVEPEVRQRGGLLRAYDFRHLWAADLVSQLGTRLSMIAVPLLAVIVLRASTLEVSLLRTAQTLGSLVLGLLVGAWVDRLRCRPVLVVADLARFGLLASVPVAGWLGVLSLWQLYAVVLGVGVGTVFFDTAHTTYLPRLVGRDHVVEANARLASNTSMAAVAGAGVGGYLVQWLTAPVTIAIDALSYLWSALWLRTIRHREPPPARAPDARLWREIREGLGFVVRHPVLRAIAANSATVLLFQSANDAIMIVFLVRAVGLSPGLIGLLAMVGLVGALVASLVAGRIAARIGTARTLLVFSLVNGTGFLLYALTGPGWRLGWYVAAGWLAAFAIVVRHVVEVSARQQLTPDRLLGRVNATMELAIWGVMPIGAVLGGVLGTLLGLRTALAVEGVGIALSALWVWLSPLRRSRDIGVPADDQSVASS